MTHEEKARELRRIHIITEEINRMCAISKLDGWNEAIEAAAKVAEKCLDEFCPDEIAESINKLKRG